MKKKFAPKIKFLKNFIFFEFFEKTRFFKIFQKFDFWGKFFFQNGYFFPQNSKMSLLFWFWPKFLSQFDLENRDFAIFGTPLGTFFQVKIKKIFAPPFLFSFFLVVSGRARKKSLGGCKMKWPIGGDLKGSWGLKLLGEVRTYSED